MEEIINQIPGYEKGKVQRVVAGDVAGECLLIAQMVADLQKKWNTTVLCMSLDGQKDAIQALIPEDKAFAKAIVMDQKNPDCFIVRRKVEGKVHRAFVRAVIIGGAQRLNFKNWKRSRDEETAAVERELGQMAAGENIPVILLQTK